MVVWGHFELILRLCYEQTDIVVTAFDRVEDLWVSFFMPAFFFITGVCSNFQKPFKQFAILNFKTILFPAFIISSVLTLCEYVQWNIGVLWIVKTMIKSSLTRGLSGEWFLSSLFLAKIGCWAILRIRRKSVAILLSCVLFVVGIILYNSFSEIPDIWFVKHALIAIIFMMSGILVKGKLSNCYKLWWLYCPMIVLVMVIAGCGVIKSGIPFFTNRINIQYIYIPLYIVLSFTGINFILAISKRIGSSMILEYLGRNSLVIFLLHFTFYKVFLECALPFIGQSVYTSVLVVVVVYTLNVISCCGCAYLLNLKHLRWILGK
jgi:fucose 4-O-acetylase-like acetyltransferase